MYTGSGLFLDLLPFRIVPQKRGGPITNIHTYYRPFVKRLKASSPESVLYQPPIIRVVASVEARQL
jgi:hypothetical protein